MTARDKLQNNTESAMTHAPECDVCRTPLPSVYQRYAGPDWELLCADCAAARYGSGGEGG